MAFFCCVSRIHGEKPDGQGQLGVGEDRAGGQRGLVAAVPALHQLARAQGDEALGMPALRADEALRPAPAEQRVGALRLGAVLREKVMQTQTLPELDAVLGHVRTPGGGGYGASVRPPVAQNVSLLSLVGNQVLLPATA
jgi:hypothetical protein